MSALLKPFTEYFINHEIECHRAWLGRISGLKAEKLLIGRKRPFLYILRAGEKEEENSTDYYVSFILPDFSIKHQPFVITETLEGWYFENGSIGGPFIHQSIADVMHLMMHCPKEACTPLIL